MDANRARWEGLTDCCCDLLGLWHILEKHPLEPTQVTQRISCLRTDFFKGDHYPDYSFKLRERFTPSAKHPWPAPLMLDFHEASQRRVNLNGFVFFDNTVQQSKLVDRVLFVVFLLQHRAPPGARKRGYEYACEQCAHRISQTEPALRCASTIGNSTIIAGSMIQVSGCVVLHCYALNTDGHSSSRR